MTDPTSPSATRASTSTTESATRPPRRRGFYLPTSRDSPATRSELSTDSPPVRSLHSLDDWAHSVNTLHAADTSRDRDPAHRHSTSRQHRQAFDHITDPGDSSAMSTPVRRRSSRASVAGLREALQAYQVAPSPAESESLFFSPERHDRDGRHASDPGHLDYDPSAAGPSYLPFTPPGQISSSYGHQRHVHHARHQDHHRQGTDANEVSPDTEVSRRMSTGTSLGLRSAFGGSLSGEMMDAVVEIHRVLYRGREDVASQRADMAWEQQGAEVRRVIERWFEDECVYDHPMVKVSSRDALLSHFILLHLLASPSLPSLTPFALLSHAKGIVSAICGRTTHDASAQPGEKPAKLATKGKSKLAAEEEWLGLPFDDTFISPRDGAHPVSTSGTQAGKWRLWDVSAECREIGGMECYDGYHMAMIDHVISLNLFPSLRRMEPVSVSASSSSLASDDPSNSHSSFPRRIAAYVAAEVCELLSWDLRINTIVHFNEVGKATHIRDHVDVRDLFETVVPFGRRLSWATRRLTGLVSSSLGALALVLGPFTPGLTTPPPPPAGRGRSEAERYLWSVRHATGGLDAPAVNVAVDLADAHRRARSDSSDTHNSLGLEGVGARWSGGPAGLDTLAPASMAPDVDGAEVETGA